MFREHSYVWRPAVLCCPPTTLSGSFWSSFWVILFGSIVTVTEMDVSWQDNPCVLHCGSGMVDTNLRNVPVGGWNRVIHTSMVDAAMSKGWQSDRVPTKTFPQLFFLVMVFLVLSQKILEKWRLSLGRWWTQCSVKSWFLLSTSAFGVWVWQNPCINCVKMAYIKHTHSQIYTHSNTFICTCTYTHTHTCS